MIEEKHIPDESLRILPDGQIEVREATIVTRDGAADPAFPPRYHRYVLAPGSDLTAVAPRIAAVAAALWTPDVISAFAAAQNGGL